MTLAASDLGIFPERISGGEGRGGLGQNMASKGGELVVVVYVSAWLRPGRNAGLAGNRTVSYLAAFTITFCLVSSPRRVRIMIYSSKVRQSIVTGAFFFNDGRLFR